MGIYGKYGHWPLIIFTGYQYGSGYWGAPYTGMSVMLLFAVSLGTLLTYLYASSHCIWIPALTHGSINAISGIGLYFMKNFNSGCILGPEPSGLLSVIPLCLVAIVVINKFKKLGDLL